MKTPVINILLASVLCFTLAACDNRDARRAADAAEKLVAMKEAEEAAERESNRREVEIQRAIERRQWQDREDNQNGQATFMLDVEIAARKRFPAGAGQEEEYKAAVTEGKDAIERRFGVRP